MIFCAVSNGGTSEAVVSLSKVSAYLGVSIDFVWSTLVKLAEDLKLIVITNGSNPEEVGNQTEPNGSTTYVRTNGTKRTNDTHTIPVGTKPIPKEKKPSADSANAEVGKLASQVIARYCELWKSKYKTNISFSNKWAGNAKTLVKDHGLNRSLELVESFMEMNDSWFLQNSHSFDLILTKLASIARYDGTGVQINKTQAIQLDKSQANKSAGDDAAAYFRKQKENL